MKNRLLHTVTSIALLFSPILNFAQAPTLGTAADFVLFSSTGALENVGISFQTHLIGNIGKDGAGAITGFGNVNGVIHNNDAASHQAASDLLLAYTQLIGASSQTGHAPALGGATLVAGAYAIFGAATLDGTLTLDGQLNPNAVFIINIGGAFSTSDSAKVNLINGTQPCNVFWTTSDVVTLNKATTMKGTIIANNAAIIINSDVSLEGRVLTTTGAITVNKITANIPTGCSRPVLTGPPAPNLLSTACYAIFTSGGDVTGDEVSTVTGDIGSNFGLTAGYDPLKVTGTIHPIPDVSTGQCAEDLIKVRDYLDELPHDIELLVPTEFGHDLTLTPHTYFLAGATTFTDTLFLDAQNNADAIFVIVVNGALATGTGATVTLLNGAKASNVFWRVTGAVDVEINSDFKGTVIVTGGAISLKTGVKLDGRALTTAGAFSTSAITATTHAACSILPVSWLYFHGKPVQKNVLLEWKTTAEINNGFFTIEKSREGVTFETLTTINAFAGTANTDHEYSITDHQPYHISYYRISQTNKDGRKNYFRTVEVKMDIPPGLSVFHYVQQNYIYMQVSGAIPSNGSVEVYGIDGRKILSQNVVITGQVNTFKINKQLQKGIYLINLVSQGQKLYNSKVLVL